MGPENGADLCEIRLRGYYVPEVGSGREDQQRARPVFFEFPVGELSTSHCGVGDPYVIFSAEFVQNDVVLPVVFVPVRDDRKFEFGSNYRLGVASSVRAVKPTACAAVMSPGMVVPPLPVPAS